MYACFDMDSFFGRQKELDQLEEFYRSTHTEFIPIYGRRRVGKSELILHFIQKKPSLYFLGKKSTAIVQIKEFMNEAALSLKQPLLAQLDVTDWKTALETVSSQINSNKKWVVVFDEFQWIVESSPELPSVLQDFLDRRWKKNRNIFLVLCGSYLGFMEKEVLGEKSPLFGRRSGQILLKPFSYPETAQFHPSWSLADKAKVYFICGGIPMYLKFFDQKKSINFNIQHNFLNEYSALFREPDFLLREELRELQKYYVILMALASGSHTSQTISQKTGIDDRKIYYYMQGLIDLGYVRRHFPLTHATSSVKDVRFVLEDPLLSFWFYFVYPHLSSISVMGPQDSFTHLIKHQLDSYFGCRFEDLCRKALFFIYQKEGITSSFEIGEYWDKEVQIDVVGYRKNEAVDIGECKWGKVNSTKKLLIELKEKIKKYPNKEGLTVRGNIFTQKKMDKSEVSDVHFYCLEDLYRL